MKLIGRALLLYAIVVIVVIAAVVVLSEFVAALLGPRDPLGMFVPWLVAIALIPFIRPLEERVRMLVYRVLP